MFRFIMSLFSNEIADSDPDNSVASDRFYGKNNEVSTFESLGNKFIAQPVSEMSTIKPKEKKGPGFSKWLQSWQKRISMIDYKSLEQSLNEYLHPDFVYKMLLEEKNRPLSTKARKYRAAQAKLLKQQNNGVSDK